ncbi:MAG: hypothetical protein WA864_25815 [Acetobacteraceae bacterium]
MQIGDLMLQTGNLTLQCIAGRLLLRDRRSFRRVLRKLLFVLSDLILQRAVLSLQIGDPALQRGGLLLQIDNLTLQCIPRLRLSQHSRSRGAHHRYG